MLLFRLILLLIIGYLAWRILRLLGTRADAASKPSLESERMVRCASCSLHVPQHIALEHDGAWFCCEEHLRQHQSRHAGRGQD